MKPDLLVSFDGEDSSSAPVNSFSVDLADVFYYPEPSVRYLSEISDDSQISYTTVLGVVPDDESASSRTDNLVVRQVVQSSDDSDSSSDSSEKGPKMSNFSVATSLVDANLFRKKAENATLDTFRDAGFIKGLAGLFY